MNNNYLNKCYLKRIIFNQLFFLYESKRKKIRKFRQLFRNEKKRIDSNELIITIKINIFFNYLLFFQKKKNFYRHSPLDTIQSSVIFSSKRIFSEGIEEEKTRWRDDHPFLEWNPIPSLIDKSGYIPSPIVFVVADQFDIVH